MITKSRSEEPSQLPSMELRRFRNTTFMFNYLILMCRYNTITRTPDEAITSRYSRRSRPIDIIRINPPAFDKSFKLIKKRYNDIYVYSVSRYTRRRDNIIIIIRFLSGNLEYSIMKSLSLSV